jgi:hypothetical protein
MPHVTKRDMTKWLIAAVALAVPQFTPAKAPAAESLHRELRIMATVGNEARVYAHLRLTPGCGQGAIPKMTVIKPPSIGKLSSRVETVTMTDPNFGPCGAGATATGRVVYYTADRPGTDAFVYRTSSPGLPSVTWSVNAEVR